MQVINGHSLAISEQVRPPEVQEKYRKERLHLIQLTPATGTHFRATGSAAGNVN